MGEQCELFDTRFQCSVQTLTHHISSYTDIVYLWMIAQWTTPSLIYIPRNIRHRQIFIFFSLSSGKQFKQWKNKWKRKTKKKKKKTQGNCGNKNCNWKISETFGGFVTMNKNCCWSIEIIQVVVSFFGNWKKQANWINEKGTRTTAANR